ncbi:hypothetical protein WJX73_010705 [Symbiochloris irregularis]|uniref:Uncharacterized protein n=1 Tax=Symbiochloris irregularis TaxID=706552 RepID=A0AAW1PQM6_9CHLO
MRVVDVNESPALSWKALYQLLRRSVAKAQGLSSKLTMLDPSSLPTLPPDYCDLYGDFLGTCTPGECASARLELARRDTWFQFRLMMAMLAQKWTEDESLCMLLESEEPGICILLCIKGLRQRNWSQPLLETLFTVVPKRLALRNRNAMRWLMACGKVHELRSLTARAADIRLILEVR